MLNKSLSEWMHWMVDKGKSFTINYCPFWFISYEHSWIKFQWIYNKMHSHVTMAFQCSWICWKLIINFNSSYSKLKLVLQRSDWKPFSVLKHYSPQFYQLGSWKTSFKYKLQSWLSAESGILVFWTLLPICNQYPVSQWRSYWASFS